MDTMTLSPVQTHSVQPPTLHMRAAVTQSSPDTASAPVISAPSLSTESTAAQQPESDKRLSMDAQKKILQKSTEKFNEMSDKLNLDIKFAYNDKIDQVYLNVIDKNTGQIIRKLPSEDAMKISESMKDLIGTLFDKKG